MWLLSAALEQMAWPVAVEGAVLATGIYILKPGLVSRCATIAAPFQQPQEGVCFVWSLAEGTVLAWNVHMCSQAHLPSATVAAPAVIAVSRLTTHWPVPCAMPISTILTFCRSLSQQEMSTLGQEMQLQTLGSCSVSSQICRQAKTTWSAGLIQFVCECSPLLSGLGRGCSLFSSSSSVKSVC